MRNNRTAAVTTRDHFHSILLGAGAAEYPKFGTGMGGGIDGGALDG